MDECFGELAAQYVQLLFSEVVVLVVNRTVAPAVAEKPPSEFDGVKLFEYSKTLLLLLILLLPIAN